MKRPLAFTIVAAACMFASAPAVDAYLKLGTRVGTNVLSLHWATFPIRYFVSTREVPRVNAAQFRDTIARAFASWEAIPNTSMSSQFVGFTAASPLDDDSM